MAEGLTKECDSNVVCNEHGSRECLSVSTRVSAACACVCKPFNKLGKFFAGENCRDRLQILDDFMQGVIGGINDLKRDDNSDELWVLIDNLFLFLLSMGEVLTIIDNKTKISTDMSVCDFRGRQLKVSVLVMVINTIIGKLAARVQRYTEGGPEYFTMDDFKHATSTDNLDKFQDHCRIYYDLISKFMNPELFCKLFLGNCAPGNENNVDYFVLLGEIHLSKRVEFFEEFGVFLHDLEMHIDSVDDKRIGVCPKTVKGVQVTRAMSDNVEYLEEDREFNRAIALSAVEY